MMTLRQIEDGRLHIPMSVSWYLSDIGPAQGKQDLFTRQSPQKLKILREHAIAESTISSNRIEGVEIDRKRVGTVIFGKPDLKDRNEQEVGGYKDALNLIHSSGSELPVSEKSVLQLHQLCRGQIWDAGKYKDKPIDIIERFSDGRQRIRFRSVTPEKTPVFMSELMSRWHDESREHRISNLITLAAFNLDFLCIHPFRDGNGRVSRLLLLLTCYHVGIEVGRYISLERLIEQNKERYYETLQESSHGWHEGKHNPWPYVGYILYILKKAYDEFEKRAGDVSEPKGAKSELIRAAIDRKSDNKFSISDLRRDCPSVSIDLIRLVLKDLQKIGGVKCLGKGQSAKWQKMN